MDFSFGLTLERLKQCSNPDALYKEIISLGKATCLLKKWDFSDSDKVLGCQSLLFVRCMPADGKLYFEFFSDAIFSRGLAALLIHFYNGKSLKEFLTTPPSFLKELNLGHLLSPGRSNGLQSLYKKMLELALSSGKET